MKMHAAAMAGVLCSGLEGSTIVSALGETHLSLIEVEHGSVATLTDSDWQLARSMEIRERYRGWAG